MAIKADSLLFGILGVIILLDVNHGWIISPPPCVSSENCDCSNKDNADLTSRSLATDGRLAYTLKEYFKRGFRKASIAALNLDVCGQPVISPSANQIRIVGGEQAVPHSWPWQVSVRVSGEHICGGSILDKHWVISAAHCEKYMFYGDITVVVGEHDSAADEPSMKTHTVHWTIAHEHFNHQTYDNDVMLLKLNEPLEFTDKVSPVCLPAHKDVFEPGQMCYALGWGKLEAQGERTSHLRQVGVPIISNAVCNQPNWYQGLVSNKMICAGYEQGGKDACQYDSGGPLVCESEGVWKLAGVVSWGSGCAEARRPGVYAKVSKYIAWIKQEIADN